MTVKKVNETCVCKNCGNESEMELTCTMPDDFDDDEEASSPPAENKKPVKVKGTGTCSHCGNEAEMWIDF